MLLQGKQRRIFLSLSAVMAGLCVAVSVSLFFADRFAARAERLLDDPGTEELDIADLTEETLPLYEAAIEAYGKAAFLAPLHSGYRSAMADLFSRVAVWSTTMRLMGSAPAGTMNIGPDMWASSKAAMTQALILDPSNVDLHLALGQQMMERGELEKARRQFILAASFYPVNSPTRFSVAMGLLTMGYRDDAREQAGILARSDDSYQLDDDDPMTAVMRDRITPEYETRLLNSYLYKAMEITWRTSPGDAEAIARIVKDNVDARAVERFFLVHKGMDTTM